MTVGHSCVCFNLHIASLPYSLLLGDFNDDALAPQYQTLKSFMDKYLYMFRQASTSHKLGSCLDHVYLSRGLQSMYSNCTYHPTYFSDHYYVITQLQRPHWNQTHSIPRLLSLPVQQENKNNCHYHICQRKGTVT